MRRGNKEGSPGSRLRAGLGRPSVCGLRLRGKSTPKPGGESVALLIILALIVAVFVGLGFVVKWLFIVAVIAALIWLIAFFTRGARA
jgi:hypothetical protein